MGTQYQTVFNRLQNIKDRITAGQGPVQNICLHKGDLVSIGTKLLAAIMQDQPDKRDGILRFDKTKVLEYAVSTLADLFGCEVQVTDEIESLGHIFAEYDTGEIIELIL
jgi:hypothetical protein